MDGGATKGACHLVVAITPSGNIRSAAVGLRSAESWLLECWCPWAARFVLEGHLYRGVWEPQLKRAQLAVKGIFGC